MFRSGAAPLAKTHSSFGSQPQPILQQIAKMSTFDSSKLNVPVVADTIPESTVRPSTAGSRRSVKPPVKTNIFFREEEKEEPEDECYYYDETPQVVRPNTSYLMGGQDTNDRWTTTAQCAQAGKVDQDQIKKHRGVKMNAKEKDTFLWGDKPSHEYRKPKPPPVTENDAEWEGPPEPELLTRFRDALSKRGARGILSLSKKFKIMDVSTCHRY